MAPQVFFNNKIEEDKMKKRLMQTLILLVIFTVLLSFGISCKGAIVETEETTVATVAETTEAETAAETTEAEATGPELKDKYVFGNSQRWGGETFLQTNEYRTIGRQVEIIWVECNES